MRIQLVIFLFLLSLTLQAQKKLSGRVMAAGTNNPVGSANVYLSNTSVGTITNDKGYFTIQQFPEGRFDLIVSCMGYEIYHIPVQSSNLPEGMQIVLRPLVNVLKEVVVENYDKDGWSKWGNIFMANFIGASAFARDCKFVNPDAVRLRLDKKRNTIKASASEQLVIENNALGYILKYDLTQFEYNLDTKQFVYKGYPFFEEMQTDRKRLEKQWETNRLDVYKGSMMHFMRSFYNSELKKEQFDVREWVVVPDAEKKRIKEIYQVQSKKKVSKKIAAIELTDGYMVVIDKKDTANIINADTLGYYQSVIKQIEQKNILVNVLLDKKDLAFDPDSLAVGMKYKEHLQVTYRSKKPPTEYYTHISFFERLVPVSSELFFNTEQPIFVLPNGSYYDALNLVTGYWAWWEKMCNKLPYDYMPPAASAKK